MTTVAFSPVSIPLHFPLSSIVSSQPAQSTFSTEGKHYRNPYQQNGYMTGQDYREVQWGMLERT